MKLIKLHRNGQEVLVNLSLVTEVYSADESNSSRLYLNTGSGEQEVFKVSETLDEILEKANS